MQILEGVKNTIFKKDNIEFIATERMKICQACPLIDLKGDKCLVPGTAPCCGECGCKLAFKTTSSSADDLQDALVLDPEQGTGRHVTVSSGNLIIGTSGYGIDFSATAGTGTSELFNDYEVGAMTPTMVGSSGGSASIGGVTHCVYCKIPTNQVIL